MIRSDDQSPLRWGASHCRLIGSHRVEATPLRDLCGVLCPKLCSDKYSAAILTCSSIWVNRFKGEAYMMLRTCDRQTVHP